MEFAEVFCLTKKVADVTEPEWSARTFIVVVDQVVDDTFFALKIHLLQCLFEQLPKLLAGWIKDFDLVRNSTQEGFVAQ